MIRVRYGGRRKKEEPERVERMDILEEKNGGVGFGDDDDKDNSLDSVGGNVALHGDTSPTHSGANHTDCAYLPLVSATLKSDQDSERGIAAAI